MPRGLTTSNDDAALDPESPSSNKAGVVSIYAEVIASCRFMSTLTVIFTADASTAEAAPPSSDLQP